LGIAAEVHSNFYYYYVRSAGKSSGHGFSHAAKEGNKAGFRIAAAEAAALQSCYGTAEAVL